ncbi:cytochrome b [Pseudomonas kurunegalensis]|uniref:cytochrome b n=1 Tax=Pseudomonas kurunegalensis TaxID=485880 RepID=UPI002570FB64|nr:cytochrome b [Pseudomonas kurunegalensis]WJD60705.1 cytochrome b [Pseudomonas kurunegalensis]
MSQSVEQSSPSSFNGLARVLHWLMAILVLVMLFVGVGMVSSFQHRLSLIELHRPLGIAILLLAVVRLINRLVSRSPSLPARLPAWQKIAAKASHLLLYVLLILLPLIGWGVVSAGGYPVTMVQGWNLPGIVPADPQWYAWLRDVHGVMAWTLFALVIGHLSAALFHAWVLRDGVFSQMAKGSR